MLAEDPQLNRNVWLWLRPLAEPSLDAAARDIGRATRNRWVACGTDGAWQWDAFLAPAGMPLPVLAAGPTRLSWAEVRPMLEELAEELDANQAAVSKVERRGEDVRVRTLKSVVRAMGGQLSLRILFPDGTERELQLEEWRRCDRGPSFRAHGCNTRFMKSYCSR